MYVSILANITYTRYISSKFLPCQCSRRFSGLLQTLQDCGSPPLTSRAPTLSQPTSLRTSDRRSLLAYLGLPLDLFGKVLISPRNFIDPSCQICTGCVLPTLPSTTAARPHQVSDPLFPLREHERDRAPAERYRVAC